MNRKQLIVMWYGIAIIILMLLFPPVEAQKLDDTGEFVLHYFTYDFLFNRQYIEFTILVFQCVIVSIVTAGLIVTFKDKKPRDEEKE